MFSCCFTYESVQHRINLRRDTYIPTICSCYSVKGIYKYIRMYKYISFVHLYNSCSSSTIFVVAVVLHFSWYTIILGSINKSDSQHNCLHLYRNAFRSVFNALIHKDRQPHPSTTHIALS